MLITEQKALEQSLCCVPRSHEMKEVKTYRERESEKGEKYIYI